MKTQIGNIAGVGIDVDLATGHVAVTSEGQLDDVRVEEAVEEVGHEAVLVW